jgi:hypothetical protein
MKMLLPAIKIINHFPEDIHNAAEALFAASLSDKSGKTKRH